VARRRLDLRGAAEVLGTSVDAVRKRIARGTLESEKADGKVYVWLDDGAPQSDTDALTSAKDETIAVLREQLEAERENLRAERNAHAEARRLLAAALERIPPQLEAPTAPAESRESPETPAEGRPSTTGAPEAQEPAEPRPWWRRMFGA
jgi:hypothetical protein